MSHKGTRNTSDRRRKVGSKKRKKRWQIAHGKRVLHTGTAKGKRKRGRRA